MGKNLIRLSACILVIVLTLSLFGACELPQKTFVIEEGVLTKYNGDDYLVKVPEGVTSIGGRAFTDNPYVKEAVLPEGVKSISTGAFSRCTSLDVVKFPSSLRTIGNTVFKGCTALRKIVFNEEILEIGNSAFEDCSKLVEVDIPSSLRSLGEGAFANCRTLEKITIGFGLSEIKDSTFSGCVNLVNVNLPDTILSYGAESFLDCHKLDVYPQPKLLKSIGDRAFKNCYFLEEKAYGRDTFIEVERIGSNAFENCTNILKAKTTAKFIGENAFFNCSAMKSFEVLSETCEIGDRTFGQCDSLAKFTSSLKGQIEKDAFDKWNWYIQIYLSDDVLWEGRSYFSEINTFMDGYHVYTNRG